MIQVEAGGLIPYLVCNLVLQYFASVRLIEPEGIQQMEISLFTAKVRLVSLKVREFTYSKFQQIINSTTHQILLRAVF
jgi:hypothetical protein